MLSDKQKKLKDLTEEFFDSILCSLEQYIRHVLLSEHKFIEALDNEARIELNKLTDDFYSKNPSNYVKFRFSRDLPYLNFGFSDNLYDIIVYIEDLKNNFLYHKCYATYGTSFKMQLFTSEYVKVLADNLLEVEESVDIRREVAESGLLVDFYVNEPYFFENIYYEYEGAVNFSILENKLAEMDGFISYLESIHQNISMFYSENKEALLSKIAEDKLHKYMQKIISAYNARINKDKITGALKFIASLEMTCDICDYVKGPSDIILTSIKNCHINNLKHLAELFGKVIEYNLIDDTKEIEWQF